MAGEKVNKQTRVVKKPKDSTSEPSITMTATQLKEFMAEAFQTAVGQSESVPQAARKELESNLQTTLTTRINKRNLEGQRFDQFLSDPKGPRTRIVIDKIYREFTGSHISATVNGNTVKVPVDGKPHTVHPAHYAAIRAKLMYLSATRDRAVDSHDLFGDDVGDYQKVEQR